MTKASADFSGTEFFTKIIAMENIPEQGFFWHENLICKKAKIKQNITAAADVPEQGEKIGLFPQKKIFRL